MSRPNHVRPSFFVLCTVLWAIIAAFTSAHSPQMRALATHDTSTQFTSQGHVLGFRASEFFLSNATYALRVQFIGANAVTPQIEGETLQRNVSTEFSRAIYANLWDGITLTYDKGGGIVRSTYRVEPFANPNAIRLRYNAPMTLNADGTLTTKFETGQLTETAPIAWQDINGARVNVPVRFSVVSHQPSIISEQSPVSGLHSPLSSLAFAVGDYDTSRALYIDPTVTWNTFLGGSADDAGNAVAVDENGNSYVTGSSLASWGSPVRAFTSSPDEGDAFVAKVDANGNLLWNTFLGGAGDDGGNSIAVDEDGNVYVSGFSGSSWGSPVRAYSSINDAFAVKLDANGNLLWNTFLGGASDDYGGGIAVSDIGNVFVLGSSWASWGTDPKRAYSASADGFMAKLDSSGALTWHTFLGGTGLDGLYGIAVDVNEVVYGAGTSTATWGSPVRAYSSARDAFAVKVGTDGTLVWSTFLGGTANDDGNAIGWDFYGNVYISGASEGTWETPIRAYASLADAFVGKLDIDGNFLWNTFLGGTGNDYGKGLAVEGYETVYAGGNSSAAWGSPVRAFSASTDVFAAKLYPNGSLSWNTFLGSGEGDEGGRIARDGTDIYVVGYSPETWGSPVRAHDAGDNNDAFAVKLSPPANNDFANATSISGDTGLVSSSTHYADKETGEPNHGGSAGGASVWYNWTPATNGSVTFWIQTSDHDTLLGSYTGSSVSGLTTVASNDDCMTGQTWSCLTFQATGGIPYHIAVDGYLGTRGIHSLKWACAAKPTLLKPVNNATIAKAKVKFDWTDVCGNTYTLVIKDAATNQTVHQADYAVSNAKVTLAAGKTYKWFVKACTPIKCKKSATLTFKR